MSSLLLSLFLMAAVTLAAEGFTDIIQVTEARAQLDQALTLALDSAVAQGPAAPAGPTSAFAWNPAAAQAAAEQAITTVWPVRVTQSGSGWATFAPVGAVPPNWAGPLQLSQFQTGNTPGYATLYGTSQAEDGPYVAAALSVPLTVRFFGVPLTFTLQAARADTIYGSNGQIFERPPA